MLLCFYLLNRYLNRHSYNATEQLLFISRMPELCAILQLVSAPLKYNITSPVDSGDMNAS